MFLGRSSEHHKTAVAVAIPSEEQWDISVCVCVRLCSRARASKALEEWFCYAVDLCISCIDEGWLLVLPISIRGSDGALGTKKWEINVIVNIYMDTRIIY